ncbi:MAG TPA: hypothetical protein VEQ63_12610 [Bryobacteraceae bacterium]|nr:hypothetical protein [Bryobacteraceae bacterium]
MTSILRLGLAILACQALFASGTASWEMNNFSDFVKGRFTGLSLSRDGKLTLAPRLSPLFISDQPALWAVARASDGTLYAGTGHRGRVYRIAPDGTGTILWNATEPEVFALTVGADGSVYAGTSPDGKVYRIRNGRAEPFFDPHSRYIWSLAFGRDGALYVATGDQGKVFRVDASGKGEVFYETGQSHVTALLPEANGSLLAGTEPNGILYRISAKDKAFVLYDGNLPEIHSIAVAADGAVYAAALGGSVAQKTGAAASQTTTAVPQVGTPITTVTVTDEAQTGIELKPKAAENAKAVATVQPGATVFSAQQELGSAVEKSALYKINPDNTVETVWTSREENIYDVLVSGGTVLFSTDNNGRIYRLSPDRSATLVLQTNEGETTRLLSSGDTLLAATGSMGKLFRIGGGYAQQGVYESPVHDAGTVARWGQLSWRGERRSGAKLVFRTRSGNSARPDRTWSEWSNPLSEPAGTNVSSPTARFLQWKAELEATPGADSPSLTSTTLTYLPQNTPPLVRSINVTTTLAPLTTAGRAAPNTAGSSTYSITVTDTGESGASTLSGTPVQTVARGVTQQIQITWQAEDPDADRLAYSIYFKGEDETQWKLLRGNFAESSFTLDGDIFADGKYLFRVLATDRPSNSASTARESDLTSAPVVFDNTPPVLTAAAPRRAGGRVEIDVTASDASSGLRRAEYSVDATHWVPIEPADGITDGQIEQFALRLENLAPGEHLVVIRAFDAANNAGLAKVVIAP